MTNVINVGDEQNRPMAFKVFQNVASWDKAAKVLVKAETRSNERRHPGRDAIKGCCHVQELEWKRNTNTWARIQRT